MARYTPNSTIYNAPPGYEEFSPYTLAPIRLDEGPQVTAQLIDVDHDEAEVGVPVEMVTHRIRRGQGGVLGGKTK